MQKKTSWVRHDIGLKFNYIHNFNYWKINLFWMKEYFVFIEDYNIHFQMAKCTWRVWGCDGFGTIQKVRWSIVYALKYLLLPLIILFLQFVIFWLLYDFFAKSNINFVILFVNVNSLYPLLSPVFLSSLTTHYSQV